MKKIKFTFQKIITTLLILSFFLPAFAPKKAHATPYGDMLLGSILGTDIASKIMHGGFQAKDILTAGYNLYQNTLAAKNLIQGIKNFDAETFAKNASGEALNIIADAVLVELGMSKDMVTNVFTQGQQVVTNLGNYLDLVAANEIKKGLAELMTTANTSPYTYDITRNITEFVRRTSETAVGKLVTFTLPYIAKDEICGSPSLKDIIRNGEPETYTLPKKAVGNVDIDKLCNTSLQSPQKEAAEAQAIFVGLAKAGYGGPRTSAALADSANTPSGVTALAIATLMEKRDKLVDEISRQTEATGLFIGNQKCIDKDGYEVDFDPSDGTQYCDRQFVTPQGSGSVLMEKIAAAVDAPYKSIMAKMDAINNMLPDGSFATSDVWAIASKIVSMGQKDMYDIASNDGDGYYTELANSISSLQRTKGLQKSLWAKTEEESRVFNYGTTTYSTSDLQNTLEVYKQIRELNTQRLNAQAYTYLLLKYAVMGSEYAVRDAGRNAYNAQKKVFLFFIGARKAKEAAEKASAISQTAEKLAVALFNERMSTRQLIKDMALNNFREQQMQKLLEEFRNKRDVDTTKNQDALAQALDGTLTLKDYALFQEDWNYIPRYRDVNNDPTSNTDPKALIPDTDEIKGPYTENNLFFLRVRSFKIIRGALSGGAPYDLSPTAISTLRAYGINGIDELTPNIERPVRARTATNTAILDPDKSKGFSELAYCKYLQTDICDRDDLNTLGGIIKNIREQREEEERTEREACLNPDTSLRNFCSQAAGDTDPEVIAMCQDESSMQTAIQNIRESCAAY